jgi:phosphoribosylglycinamide formyltransferase-1
MPYKIAVFASGRGSNTQNIIDVFKDKDIEVALIVSNNPDAGVLEVAKSNNIPYLIIDRNDLYNSSDFVKYLIEKDFDLIVLAGFLWLIPKELVIYFKNKIINIHPALLPKYGGKGMYGMKVHQAVKNAGERNSGITIHYVNENFDEGNIIFQAKTEINVSDKPEDIANKIHLLEYRYFPEVIEKILKKEKISY